MPCYYNLSKFSPDFLNKQSISCHIQNFKIIRTKSIFKFSPFYTKNPCTRYFSRNHLAIIQSYNISGLDQIVYNLLHFFINVSLHLSIVLITLYFLYIFFIFPLDIIYIFYRQSIKNLPFYMKKIYPTSVFFGNLKLGIDGGQL